MSSTNKVQIKIIDASFKKKWESYVDQHPHASPYHYMGWQESIEYAYKHKPLYIAAIESDNAGNNICGILPIIEMTIPLIGSHLCSLPFCDIGACLADNYAIEIALVDFAKKTAREKNFRLFEYRHAESESLSEERISYFKKNQITPPKVRMLMLLPENSDALWDSFKSKLRSQIRKAEKNQLTYSTGNDPAHLHDFYTVFSHNMRDLGSPVHSIKLFESLQSHYKSKLLISVVRLNDTPVAAGIILMTPKIISIPWASTISTYNKLSPNMLLYWSLLKISADSNSDTFDFGRSTLGEGTYKFKSQWGAKATLLTWEKYSHQQLIDNSNIEKIKPQQSSIKPFLRKSIVRIWQKLPLSLSTTLGPVIRKYIDL